MVLDARVTVMQSLTVHHHNVVPVRKHRLQATDEVVPLALVVVVASLVAIACFVAAAAAVCCRSAEALLPWHSSLLHLLAEVWTSSVRSASCVSCTALVAARHIRRRPRFVHMYGLLSARIHQTFRHHVTRLFDTWFSSYIVRVFLFFYNAFLSRRSPSSSRAILDLHLSFLFSLLLQNLCSSHFPFSIFLSLHFFLTRLMRSPLFSRFLRSPLLFLLHLGLALHIRF